MARNQIIYFGNSQLNISLHCNSYKKYIDAYILQIFYEKPDKILFGIYFRHTIQLYLPYIFVVVIAVDIF